MKRELLNFFAACIPGSYTRVVLISFVRSEQRIPVVVLLIMGLHLADVHYEHVVHVYVLKYVQVYYHMYVNYSTRVLSSQSLAV